MLGMESTGYGNRSLFNYWRSTLFVVNNFVLWLSIVVKNNSIFHLLRTSSDSWDPLQRITFCSSHIQVTAIYPFGATHFQSDIKENITSCPLKTSKLISYCMEFLRSSPEVKFSLNPNKDLVCPEHFHFLYRMCTEREEV